MAFVFVSYPRLFHINCRAFLLFFLLSVTFTLKDLTDARNIACYDAAVAFLLLQFMSLVSNPNKLLDMVPASTYTLLPAASKVFF